MPVGVGAALREARRARGLDLDDVFRETKIRPRYLAAIEEERWDVLPAPAYARAFVRTYAAMVDLDPDELIAQLDAELDMESVPEPPVRGEEPTTGSHPVLQPVDRPRRPVAGFAFAALAVAVASALVFLLLREQPDSGREAGVSGPAQQQVEAGSEEPTTESESTDRSEVRPRRAELSLVPDADAWVCLLDSRERALIEGEIVPAGERRGPFRSREFTLALGHGQVEVEVDGEPIPMPDTPDPTGMRISPDGAQELSADELPDCL